MILRKSNSAKKIILFFLGFSMAFGEQLNKYIPGASHLFVIMGISLSIISFFLWMLKGKSKIIFYTREYIYYVLFLTYLAVLLTAKLMIDIGFLDGNSFFDYYKQVVFMVIGLTTFSLIKDDEEFSFSLARGFLIGFFLMLPVGSYGLYDETRRLLGTYINPNAYAIDCCLAFYCALFLLGNNRFRVLKYVVAGIALLLLLLTGTRGALIGMVISIGLLIIQQKRGNRRFIFIMTSIVLLISIGLFFSGSDNSIFKRLLSSESNAAAEFRFTIWGKYLQNTDLFFWIGMKESDFGLIYKKSPHNTILGTFVRYGVLSVIIFIIFVFGMAKKSVKLVINQESTLSSKIVGCMFLTRFIAGITTEDMMSRSTYIIMAITMAELYRYTSDVRYKNGKIRT